MLSDASYSEVLETNRFLYRSYADPSMEMETSHDYTRQMTPSIFSNMVAKNMSPIPKADTNNKNNSGIIVDNDMKHEHSLADSTTKMRVDQSKDDDGLNDVDDESVSSELDTSGASADRGSGKKNKTLKTTKKQSFTFSDCKICNDKATGVHYGISTCEGCKGFFKRNIQRNVYYQCFFGQNCKITPRTRNRCKACRLKRCIEVGMSFDGIKMGRIPKEVKKQALESKLLNEQENNSVGGGDSRNGPLALARHHQMLQSMHHLPVSKEVTKENYAVDKKSPDLLYGYSNGSVKKSTDSTSFGSISSSDSNNSNCQELQGFFSLNMNIKSNDKPDSERNLANDTTPEPSETQPHEPHQQQKSYTTTQSLQQQDENNNISYSIINKSSSIDQRDTRSTTNNNTQSGNEIVELTIEDDDTSTYEAASTGMDSMPFNSSPLQLVSSQDMKELSLEQFLKSVNSGNKAARTSKTMPEGTVMQQKMFDSMAHQDEQLRMNSVNNPKSTNLAFTNIVNNLSPFNLMNVNINSKFLHMYMCRTHYDPYFQVICSVLNDKIYQLYNEHVSKPNVIYYKLQKVLKQKAADGENYVQDPDFPLDNGSLELIWNGLIESLPEYVQSTFYFCKEMPGINELTQKDFSAILNNKLFEMFIIIHSKYFIDGESYLRLSNDTHYSRYWMNKVKGKKKTDATFELAEMLNEAQMTEKERALLLPLMMTTCECDDEYLILKDLNEYYTRAILYEFDLNNRDESFIIKMSKIISEIKKCKQIEMEVD